MPKEQRTFTKEFKLEAVRLVQTSGKSITQVARDLGIADSTLYHWCKLKASQGEQALHMALGHRHTAAGMLYHSDRGNQYTSGSYQTLLAQTGIAVSMSGKGDCYDNAAMESFFSSRVWRVDGLASLSDPKGGRSCRTLSTSKCFTIDSASTLNWTIGAQ
jgi:hypothetical protein